MRTRTLITAVSVTILAALTRPTAAAEKAPPPDRPNVLLVVIDTLRADHLGCYGHERDTSARLDKLAREGFVFDRCYSTSSWTLPACASLFTSLYPDTHGVQQWRSVVPKHLRRMPEILQAAGYHCAGVSSNPFLSKKQGFAQGFDVFDDSTVLAAAEWSFPLAGSKYRSVVLASTGAATTRRAAELLNEMPKDKPFFLFVHYMDPHADYVPPAPFDAKFDPQYKGATTGRVQSERFDADIADRDLQHVISLYDGEIAYCDQQLSQLLGHVEALGAARNTCVVVTADHGEELLEHGNWGHGHTLFEECVRVPLVLWWPGHVPAGQRSGALVSLVDVAPTLLGLLGLERPNTWQGLDLKGVLRGTERLEGRTIVMQTSLGSPLRAILTGRMKLICESRATASLQGKPAEQPKLLLFDLSRNPREVLTDTVDSEERRMEMLTRYNDVLAELNRSARALMPEGADRAISPDAKLMERLRSLGYVGN